MKGSGCYITYEERKRLRRLAAEGHTRDDIADLIGRSRRSIDRYFTLLGLTERPKLKERLPQSYRDYETPEKVKIDHLAHCLAILNADERGKPYGCGFPICDARPTYRVAA